MLGEMANHYNAAGIKRKRIDDDFTYNLFSHNGSSVSSRPKNFVRLAGSSNTFHSELWKEDSQTLYLPVQGDLLINMTRIEQVSFASGTFFVCDSAGNYASKESGQVVNFWKYDVLAKRLFISRSLLFTDAETYREFAMQLDLI